MDKLTVGHIPYLNCVPFFHYLTESGFRGELISGVPSALNKLLQQGRLDVSPSSSFEYARHWQDYLLLPGHSISSLGKVHSVLLFSPVGLFELEGKRIAITGESATSINLLRILLREFYDLDTVNDYVPKQPVEQLIEKGQPALLIGDRALKMAARLPEKMSCYDLGELWHQQTGLPFVFAIWMIRRAALPRFELELAMLGRQLQASLEKAQKELAALVGEYELPDLAPQQIIDYWQSIDYRLEDAHLQGLRLFFRLCKKHQLLKQEPPLDFFQPNLQ